jgi:hypothetical protein
MTCSIDYMFCPIKCRKPDTTMLKGKAWRRNEKSKHNKLGSVNLTNHSRPVCTRAVDNINDN